MNLTVMTGNLAADPEYGTTTSGHEVCRLRIAVNRQYRQQDGTRPADYFTVVCWGALASNCAKFLTKGRKVGVKGRLETHSFEGRDGQTHYVTEITAEEVEFLGSKTDGAEAQ